MNNQEGVRKKKKYPFFKNDSGHFTDTWKILAFSSFNPPTAMRVVHLDRIDFPSETDADSADGPPIAIEDLRETNIWTRVYPNQISGWTAVYRPANGLISNQIGRNSGQYFVGHSCYRLFFTLSL